MMGWWHLVGKFLSRERMTAVTARRSHRPACGPSRAPRSDRKGAEPAPARGARSLHDLGNQAVQRLLRRRASGPHPEAAPLERPPPSFGPQGPGRSPTPAERQADAIGDRIGEGLATVGSVVPGPLPEVPRRVAERHLGVSLGAVELRAGANTDRELRAAGALGVTERATVTLDTREFSTATPEGRALIGHELTHVAQQLAHGAQSARQFQQRRPPEVADMVEPSLLRESDLQGSPNWCRDSAFSSMLHEGTCYRSVPHRTGPDDCPPGEQLCFDKLGELLESSPDHVSPVEGREADGTCDIGYFTECADRHAEEDKVYETFYDQYVRDPLKRVWRSMPWTWWL